MRSRSAGREGGPGGSEVCTIQDLHQPTARAAVRVRAPYTRPPGVANAHESGEIRPDDTPVSNLPVRATPTAGYS